MLQNELLYLHTENSLLIQVKKLDITGDVSIERLEDAADFLFCERESLRAEVADINMEKSKLHFDDDRERITQDKYDAVPSQNVAPGSEARPPTNQTMKFDIVDSLQNLKPYSSEAPIIDNENAQELNWTANNDGRFEYTEGQWKTDIGGSITV